MKSSRKCTSSGRVSISKSVILSEIADRRIKPPSIKSDVKEICRNVKLFHPFYFF